MSLSIVIPCYNEADNIPKLTTEFLPVARKLAAQTPVEVIFVDDGSRDETWTALNAVFGNFSEPNLTFRIEKHAVNQGLGAAVRTGLAASQGDVVVTTDSDGTYIFENIPQLLARLTPDVDIVTASPYHPQGGVENVPAYRLFFSQGSSMLYRILVDGRVHTYTALFRAYRRSVITHITFQSNGFLCNTELMVKAMLAGFKVAEFPAVLRSRQFGQSKAKIIRTIKEHLKFQWRIVLHHLRLAPLTNAGMLKQNIQWTS